MPRAGEMWIGLLYCTPRVLNAGKSPAGSGGTEGLVFEYVSVKGTMSWTRTAFAGETMTKRW